MMDASRARAFRAKYGPWAVVAGASAGLGAEYAAQLAAAGLDLVLVARRTVELEALAASLRQRAGVDVRTLPLDLALPGAAATLDQQTSDLDVGLLIYNATRSLVGPFLDLPLDDHLDELAVNTCTPMELAWRFGQRLSARGRGGMILMSSVSASQGAPLVSNYGATKAYGLVLAEGLWEEWRARGVDVLAVQPAVIAEASGAQPQRAAGATTLTPDTIAREALAALGHGPSVTPGATVKLVTFFMRRIMPRASAIRMLGRVMRQMYGASSVDGSSRAEH